MIKVLSSKTRNREKENNKTPREMGYSLRIIGRVFNLHCVAPFLFTLGSKISYIGTDQAKHLHSLPR